MPPPPSDIKYISKQRDDIKTGLLLAVLNMIDAFLGRNGNRKRGRINNPVFTSEQLRVEYIMAVPMIAERATSHLGEITVSDHLPFGKKRYLITQPLYTQGFLLNPV